LELLKHIDRYAIVGGPDWIRNLSGVLGALLKPEIKGFELEDLDEAMEWLGEGLSKSGAEDKAEPGAAL
ncbi:MAG: STAS/SEC14 domain-containing protein, partial [Pseudomonadota bacterium]